MKQIPESFTEGQIKQFKQYVKATAKSAIGMMPINQHQHTHIFTLPIQGKRYPAGFFVRDGIESALLMCRDRAFRGGHAHVRHAIHLKYDHRNGAFSPPEAWVVKSNFDKTQSLKSSHELERDAFNRPSLFFDSNGRDYLAMKNLGISLFDFLETPSKLSIHEFLSILKSMAVSVLNLHNNGFFHGDIKSENICIHNAKASLIDLEKKIHLNHGTEETWSMSPELCHPALHKLLSISKTNHNSTLTSIRHRIAIMIREPSASQVFNSLMNALHNSPPMEYRDFITENCAHPVSKAQYDYWATIYSMLEFFEIMTRSHRLDSSSTLCMPSLIALRANLEAALVSCLPTADNHSSIRDFTYDTPPNLLESVIKDVETCHNNYRLEEQRREIRRSTCLTRSGLSCAAAAIVFSIVGIAIGAYGTVTETTDAFSTNNKLSMNQAAFPAVLIVSMGLATAGLILLAKIAQTKKATANQTDRENTELDQPLLGQFDP